MPVPPTHSEVRLFDGRVALVDTDDLPLVAGIRWSASGAYNTDYVRACVRGRTILMHRLVMHAPDGVCVDHVNRDGLDNRKSNLRFASPTQNNANCVVRKRSTTGVKGVRLSTWNANPRFHARITAHGVTKNLGSFDTLEDAGLAYDKAAREAFGEFSCENGGVSSRLHS